MKKITKQKKNIKPKSFSIKSESYFLSVIENQPGLVWLKNLNGSFLITNTAFAHTAGKKSPKDIQGKTDFDIWSEKLARKYVTDDNKVIKSKKPLKKEELIVDKGKLKWFETYKTPIFDKKNKVIGTTGFSLDITERKNAENNKEEILKKMSLIFNSAPDPMVISRLSDGTFLDVNLSFTNTIGFSKEEVIGKSSLKLGLWTDPKTRKNIINIIRKKGSIVNEEISITHKDKSIHPHLFSASSILIDNIPSLIISIKDITNIKQAEYELKESENKFKSIFDSSPFGMHMYELDHKNRLIFINANPAADKILKVANNQFIGKSIEKAFPALKNTSVPEAYKKVILTGKDWHDAQIFYNEGKIMGAFDVFAFKTSPKKMVASFIDISEQKKAEVEIIEKEKLFRDLFDNMDESVAVYKISNGGKDILIKDLNKSGELLEKVKRQDIIGKKIEKVFKGVKKFGLYDVIKKVWKTGKPIQHPITFYTDKYHQGWRDNFVYKLPSGNVVAIYSDVTNRKIVEEALQKSEEKFHTLFEAANDAIWIMDGDTFIDCNNMAVRMFGFKRKMEVINHTPSFFSPTKQPDGRDSNLLAKKYISAAYSGQSQKFYWQHKINNGSLIDVEVSLSRVDLKNRIYIIAIGRDITEKKKNENLLRENEKKLKTIFDNSAVGVSLISPTGQWLKVNQALCNSLGYSEKELLSKKFTDLTFPEDNTKTSIFYKSFFSDHRRYGYLEKRYIHKNGHIVWTNLHVTLIRDNKGQPLYFITVTEDVTEKIEKQNILDQSRNDFLSMSSHQLRTPLSATKWVLETLQNNSNLNEKQKIKIDDLYISNERLIHLVNNFLDVTQIQSGHISVNREKINIRELIDTLMIPMKNLADKKNKFIKINISPKIKKINCDPILTTEIIENILTNAINYSTELSTEVDLKISERKKDYLIAIHNDGFIAKNVINQIKKFEKFIRGDGAVDKEPAGSGLGLYITKKMLEASGGDMWFKSNIESGTIFYATIIKSKINK
ncbi:MAG: PAS domain S-box protein [Minisyncoccia bacterium]